jgi:hypothetical protein
MQLEAIHYKQTFVSLNTLVERKIERDKEKIMCWLNVVELWCLNIIVFLFFDTKFCEFGSSACKNI